MRKQTREPTVRVNLTKRTVEALEIPAERYSTTYDEQVRGLGVVVHSSGARSFFWCRKVRGKPTFRTIANWPDMGVEQARAQAQKWNTAVTAWKQSGFVGPSPFERPADDLTLDTLVEQYITRHLRGHAKRPEKAEKDLRWMVGFYLSAWKDRKLGEISAEDVSAWHLRAGDKHGHRSANKVVKTLRTLYRFAIAAKLWRGESPTSGITFYHEPKRTRYLAPEELAKLWTALRTAPNPDLADFVNLSLWTGARKNDIFAMRWQDVSIAEKYWTIPDPKNRVPYTVPLTDEAVQILKARSKTRTEACAWVFPSHGATGHVVDLKKCWHELLTSAGLDYPLELERRPTIHDLRRTQSSWQAGLGASLSIIGKSLGHSSTAATAVYARVNLDSVRESMDAANKAMGKAMRKKLPKAVVPKLLEAAAGA